MRVMPAESSASIVSHGTVRASSAAAAPSRMPVVSPRIRARISSCVFTVLSRLSLAITPTFISSMHCKKLRCGDR